MTALNSVLAVAPIAVYLGIFWWLDRYEREPLWVVLLTLLFGALVALPVSASVSEGVAIDAGVDDLATLATWIAPVVEEPMKALVLVFLLSSRHFDNATDGMLYGAASGLGFALFENYLYFEQTWAQAPEIWPEVVVYRGLLTALMHCSATAMVGGVIGALRYRGPLLQGLVAPLLGLVPAIALHAIFNGTLIQADLRGEDVATVPLVLIPLGALALLALTQLALYREHLTIERELRDEPGLIPATHASILPFVTRRRGSAWWRGAPEHRRRYVRAATTLAFRKHQLKRAGGDLPQLRRDVERLRAEIRRLLG